jgi:hypothetical protein
MLTVGELERILAKVKSKDMPVAIQDYDCARHEFLSVDEGKVVSEDENQAIKLYTGLSGHGKNAESVDLTDVFVLKF